MSLVNIGIAGCLGRMGKELVKEIVNNKQLGFAGGFEHSQHKNINKKISLEDPAPKPDIVLGKRSIEEAKITGITPEVLILRGKCEL